MSDDHQVVVVVDRPEISSSSSSTGPVEMNPPAPPHEVLVGASSSTSTENDEETPLLMTAAAECRICQDEDDVTNMETPCACRGTLMYAHRKCIQQWCNEKGDITCEICHQPYQPGYIAPPPPRETTIDIGGGWQISGTPLDLHDPRILAIAEAERQRLEAEDDDSTDTSGVFFRSAALMLMSLLLFWHAWTEPDSDGDDVGSNYFTFFLLRATGFLLPCYIMAWAFSILHQRRRQRQEESALTATQIAFLLQSGESRGVQFTLASPPSATPQQEHV